MPPAVRHASETLWAKRKIWAPRPGLGDPIPRLKEWMIDGSKWKILFKWMRTGGTPILGNLQVKEFLFLRGRWVNEFSVAIQSCHKVWMEYTITLRFSLARHGETDQRERWDYTRAGYHIISYIIYSYHIIYYLSSIIYCLSSTIYHLPFIIYYLPSITYHLSSIINHISYI